MAGTGASGTAAMGFGGYSGPAGANTTTVELYNGSSWTEVGDLNTARLSLAGAGTTTAGLAIGGGPPNQAIVEIYDGTAWVTSASLSTARYGLGGAGTSTLGLAFGGYVSSVVNSTEEFSGETTAAEAADISFD